MNKDFEEPKFKNEKIILPSQRRRLEEGNKKLKVSKQKFEIPKKKQIAERNQVNSQIPRNPQNLVKRSSDKKVLSNSKKINKKSEGFDIKKIIKWTLIILVVVYAYLNFSQLSLYFFDLLRANPTIYSYYQYIEGQMQAKSLLGLFYVSILGSLFFLVIPGEAMFVYYLSETNYNSALLILIMTVGNLIGLGLNYLIGRALGTKTLKLFFDKENYFSYRNKINNFGGYVLLLGNILPGPIELLSVFFGAFKFDFKRYLFLSFLGRLFKYIIIFIIFYFFWDSIMLSYTDFINNFIILKDLFIPNN